MDNNFNKDNFEEFLQNQLKNHRMFPKDAVWREINQKLHGEKRWPGLTIAGFLIVAITTAICLHFSPKQNIFSSKPILEPIQSEKSLTTNELNSPKNKLNNVSLFNENEEFGKPTKSIADNRVNLNEKAHQLISSENQNPDLADNNNSKIISENIPNTFKNTPYEVPTLPRLSNEMPDVVAPLLIVEEPTTAIINQTVPLAKNSELKIPQMDLAENELNNESVLIERLKDIKKPGKFSFLMYLAPSISYRKLSEDNDVLKSNTSGPVSISQVSDVNDVVRHKPSKGIEGGATLLYDLTHKVRIKTGFQFNVRQYNIDAFKSNSEISSIALVENNRIDTINTITNFRNYNGNSSTELQNRYYQLSMPIGMEWEIVGNKRFQFNVAGSIQPTFILNRSAYLLTTNFKNYAENDNLVRQWNINSNFEAFVTMIVGDVKWQLGPQVRYQPYSTFVKEYPIREHLIDYGIKLGISTRIK